MKRRAWASGVLAGATLLLGACSERADVNPVAPGSPGTGNEARVVEPAIPEGPPGGSTGVRGSTPDPGASGGPEMPEGTTGSGIGLAETHSQPAQPGIGLQGGLNDNAAVLGGSPRVTGPTSAPGGEMVRGSSNATSGSQTGER